MKIQNKLPSYNENRHAQLLTKQWNPMKEPANLTSAILLSIPFMMISALLSIGIIKIISGISFSEFGLSASSFSLTINLEGIVGLFFFVIFHELLHLVFIPNFLHSDKTYIGLTFWGGFVVSEEEISKARYIIITIAPFIIISVLVPIILGAFGLLTPLLKFLIVLNAVGSSVDLLNLLLVLKQVPKQATLISNGPKTYWKLKKG